MLKQAVVQLLAESKGRCLLLSVDICAHMVEEQVDCVNI